MKKLLVAAFMIASTASFAQVKTAPQGNKMFQDNTKLIETRCQKMKADFGLDDQQTAQISILFGKEQQKREAVMAEIAIFSADGGKLTEEQKKEIKYKMDALRKETDFQMKNILSPSQFAAWQSRRGIMKVQHENDVPQPVKE